jgi:hypothetical protein
VHGVRLKAKWVKEGVGAMLGTFSEQILVGVGVEAVFGGNGEEEREGCGGDRGAVFSRAVVGRGSGRGVSSREVVDRWVSRGSLRHARQSLRCLFLSCEVYGGFMAQFCCVFV